MLRNGDSASIIRREQRSLFPTRRDTISASEVRKSYFILVHVKKACNSNRIFVGVGSPNPYGLRPGRPRPYDFDSCFALSFYMSLLFLSAKISGVCGPIPAEVDASTDEVDSNRQKNHEVKAERNRKIGC